MYLLVWLFTEEDSMLTESGRNEHTTIGERYKQRLPDLMGGSYQKGAFQFRHTKKVSQSPKNRRKISKFW